MLNITEGNYAIFGSVHTPEGVIFTFYGEKEDDCKIRLVEKNTKKEIIIDADSKYCRGSLRSVCVFGFDASKYCYEYLINGEALLDPYARTIYGREIWMDHNRASIEYKLMGGFDTKSYDWIDDRMPEIGRDEMVMYKLHMRGFSMDKGASASKRGTFKGLIEKIPYLKALGITTIEVMPIYEFEEMTIPVKHKLPDYVKWELKEEEIISPIEIKASDKVNFWGYGEGNYFAPKSSYAKDALNASNELKELINCLHKNNIELVMEMYFPENVNHHLVLNALRYWVLEYHVDGFHLLGDNLPMIGLASDAILSRTKLFYQSFDEQLLQAAKHENLFVYRDDYQYPAKKLLNHMNADMVDFVNQQKKQGPNYSFVNYISSNNGFTLFDIFSYNDRHNEANGENNNDGTPWNFSNNQGVEGPSKKKNVLLARNREWKNAFVMLLTAQSVPLIWSGDEFKNSQCGNNNAYCQDNEIGWINWKNSKTSKSDIAFVSNLISFRAKHPVLSQKAIFTYSDYKRKGLPDFSIHGENAWLYDLNPGNMSIGLLYCGAYSDNKELTEDVFVAYNFYSGKSILALPGLKEEKKWHLVCATSADDLNYFEEPRLLDEQKKYEMSPVSAAIFIGK